MQRDREDKYNGYHADVYLLGVPVNETYTNKERHKNAGYYGFNINVQNSKRQNVKETIKAFNERIAGGYLSTAAVTLTPQHYPAENRYQVDRSDLCTAGHAV